MSIRSQGEGALGELIRSHDWAETPLGPIDAWPQTLKGYVSMVLSLPSPAIVFWGDERLQLYNDGYAGIMGPLRHPRYLGAPFEECWPETAAVINPWMERVSQGEVVQVDRTHISMSRLGFLEEAYFTFTFSPLRDDEGRIAGCLQLVVEMTQAVLEDRRLRTLGKLTPAALASGTAQVLAALGDNPLDVPWAVYYLPEGFTLERQGAAGIALEQLQPSALAALDRAAEQAHATNEPVEVGQAEVFHPALQAPAWPEPGSRVFAWPIRRPGERSARGALILAVSPRLRFDDRYRDFFRRVSSEIASHLAVQQELVLADQLKLVLDSAKMGSWHIDLATQRTRLSARAASFLGIAGAVERQLTALGHPQVHPEDTQGVQEALERAVRDGSLYSAEYRVVRSNGEVRWLNSWGKAAYALDRTPLALSGVSVDVTERKAVERELARHAQRVVSLLEALPTPFYSADSEARVTYINPAASKAFGVPRDTIAGKRLWDVFPGLEESAFGEFFKRVARDEERGTIEHFFPGYERWYFSWAYPSEGGTAVVFLDVTPQVEARRRIERLAAELARSVNTRDDFMSIASHELKTPLSSLRLQTEGMQRAIARGDPTAYSPERVGKMLVHTERQTMRLARLVDDMLDVARINTGKLTLVKTSVDVMELTREVTERLRPTYEARGAQLEAFAEGEALCVVDRDRIEQVLVNLLTNSLRYGRGRPVEVRAEQGSGLVRVEVRDQGIGISAEHLQRVFDRYERAISANEVSGLGLGLFISRQIVESHGGRIWVESTPGEGSRFVFELSLAPAAQ